MSKVFYDLLQALKEVAEMENCPETVKMIDGIIKNGLNEICPDGGQTSSAAGAYQNGKGENPDCCRKRIKRSDG